MNGRLDTAEEKISELEGIEIKISQNKQKKNPQEKRKENSISKPQDNIEWPNMQVIEIFKEEVREADEKNIWI